MNTYIGQLSALVPWCGAAAAAAAARKLDKLSVLRMAVQHLRAVRGSQRAGPPRPRPACVAERDLNQLLLQAAGDAFLFVVSCDRGRLLYVSHSVKAMLHYDQEDLHEHSIFDILHPKDVAKMKEQLSSSDLGPRDRFIDIKTMLPVKSDLTVASAQQLGHGVRRSFFCRIKIKQPMERIVPKPHKDNTTKAKKKDEKKYCVVQCTGYLKAWAARGEAGDDSPEEPSGMSCLVAVARSLPARSPAHEAARAEHYVSRHAVDGKFLFVDQRVTLALGFLPQELLGTSLYEYVGGPALGALARSHKEALLRRDPQLTPPYSFRRKDGSYATIQTHFKPFRNPWTKDVECLVAKNSVVAAVAAADDVAQNYEAFRQTDEWRNYLSDVRARGEDEESYDDSDVRAGLARHAAAVAAAAARARLAAAAAGAESSAGPSGGGGGSGAVQRMIESHVEVSKIGSAIAEEVSRQTAAAEAAMTQHDPIFNPSSLATEGGPPALDGNNEAAMAVIMSLLEADAGLGGPVNFSGLPWPLP